jgi:hypothetical protein
MLANGRRSSILFTGIKWVAAVLGRNVCENASGFSVVREPTLNTGLKSRRCHFPSEAKQLPTQAGWKILNLHSSIRLVAAFNR